IRGTEVFQFLMPTSLKWTLLKWRTDADACTPIPRNSIRWSISTFPSSERIMACSRHQYCHEAMPVRRYSAVVFVKDMISLPSSRMYPRQLCGLKHGVIVVSLSDGVRTSYVATDFPHRQQSVAGQPMFMPYT